MTQAGTRVVRIADDGLRLVAAVLLASLAYAAWHDVSKAWDVWFYHLPFAARITGIVDASSYRFGGPNQHRFDGFPLFGEALQGALWKITGRPECANFVALAAVPGLAWLLRKLFAVPLHVTVLAVLAVPLVQIHATACYVDLPANACATMLLLVAFRQVVVNEAPSVRALVLGGGLAAATANTKFQLFPIVLAASAVLVVLSLRRGPGRAARVIVLLVAFPLVMATPLKNVVVHGNPVWPVELRLLGRSLPHVETAYASSPDWLEHTPRPVRFFASVLELGLRPIASHRRWSIDQWTPPREPGYRMGGFFASYVIVNVLGLVYAAVRHHTRESKVALVFFIGVTALTSVLPQSHELRYYLYWMLLLVSLNLVVWSRRAHLALAVVAAAAVAVVGWSTGGTYLYASGDTFRELVAAKVDARELDRVPEGARVCIDRQPFTFLYAPRFHAPRRYSVQEAEDAEDCKGAPRLEDLPP